MIPGERDSGEKPVPIVPRVLIVEDEPAVADCARVALEQHGIQTTTCERVAEAIALLRAEDFDCILLDLKLGREHGEEIIRAVRGGTAGKRRDTPVVIMTGLLETRVLQRVRVDIRSVVLKPFKRATLLEVLLRHLPVAAEEKAA